MISLEQIAQWPGKSASDEGIEHPAIYHMLDVAAVAEVLLKQTGYSVPEKEALAFLVALHDVGKLNPGFRAMLRGEGAQNYRHWELTEVFLEANRDFLVLALHPQRPGRLDPLIGATAGHHGRPSRLNIAEKRRAKRGIGEQAQADAAQVIKAFAALWPQASIADWNEDQVKTQSWWLSGLVTTADWIGSNTEWFRPHAADLSVAEYLIHARRVAQDAVHAAGLGVVPPSSGAVFDWPVLRPMQSACRDIALPDGPALAVIEDETGAGKTEAALMLAQRMLTAGKGHGLFFALPTMATADAMFSRVSQSIGRMFQTAPTVTLAHGRAGLSGEYRDIVRGSPNAPDDVGCTGWLADSRRRALLATVGVGTVDQALLSVLPVKFQTLRHYGLSSKILIVDEVHELGEAYIAETLVSLLRLHRAAGGSAILLTATLPMDLRARLLSVYDGADDGNRAYPALTVAGGAVRCDLPQDTGAKGAVQVSRLASAADAVDLIAARAGQGAACVWVRNAVDDAIAAVQALRDKGIKADLLHARFTLGDRKRIEQAARDRFGKTGTDRAGRVLVGTQVLESSLDLDFDVMVSDLSPMAGLVQRAGRLWRHMDIRPADQRPVDAPVLYVVSPDPTKVENDRWLMEVLDRGAYVYPSDVMWRTALHLFDEGQIVAPSGIRGLIERAYSAEPETPDVLQQAEAERFGKELSHGSLACQNVVNIAGGYRNGGQAHDDARYPTRLGPEQQVLVLAKWDQGQLLPFCAGADGWAMSEVSVAKHKIAKLDLPDQQADAIRAMTADWKEWMRQEYIVCPVQPDGTICGGLSYGPDMGVIFDAYEG